MRPTTRIINRFVVFLLARDGLLDWGVRTCIAHPSPYPEDGYRRRRSSYILARSRTVAPLRLTSLSLSLTSALTLAFSSLSSYCMLSPSHTFFHHETKDQRHWFLTDASFPHISSNPKNVPYFVVFVGVYCMYCTAQDPSRTACFSRGTGGSGVLEG